jgi:hypothetical protein
MLSMNGHATREGDGALLYVNLVYNLCYWVLCCRSSYCLCFVRNRKQMLMRDSH